MNTYNWLASSICRIPSVNHIHGLWLPTPDTGFKTKLYTKLAARFSSKTVAVSNSLNNALSRNFRLPKNKLVTIHNGFNSSRIQKIPSPDKIKSFREKHLCPPGTQVVVAIGHLRKVKGYKYLLKGIHELVKDLPNIRLFIAGLDTHQEGVEVKKELEKLPESSLATFLGDFRDIEILFEIADLYVCSSISEGFSLSTVEAMAYGIPVLVTDSGGPSEIVINGTTGLVVPVSDSDALYKGMKEILTNHELAFRLGKAGKDRAYSHFPMERFIVKHEELYRELTKKNRCHS
jgi:glycosyltransferase involved in cell wall biosynthesis